MILNHFLTKATFLCCSGKEFLIVAFDSEILCNLFSNFTANIGVNFYMELSNKIIADKDAYMQFTLPNGTITKVLGMDVT